MKKVISITVLVAFAATYLINAVVLADFAFKFTFYITEVCEFRNTKVNCMGSCYLQNALDDTQSEKPNPAELRQLTLEAEPMDEPNTILDLPIVQIKPISSYWFAVPDEPCFGHFHPPERYC